MPHQSPGWPLERGEDPVGAFLLRCRRARGEVTPTRPARVADQRAPDAPKRPHSRARLRDEGIEAALLPGLGTLSLCKLRSDSGETRVGAWCKDGSLATFEEMMMKRSVPDHEHQSLEKVLGLPPAERNWIMGADRLIRELIYGTAQHNELFFVRKEDIPEFEDDPLLELSKEQQTGQFKARVKWRLEQIAKGQTLWREFQSDEYYTGDAQDSFAIAMWIKKLLDQKVNLQLYGNGSPGVLVLPVYVSPGVLVRRPKILR